MQYSNDFTCSWTSAQYERLAESILDQAWQSTRPMLLAIVVQFFANPISPSSMYNLEKGLFVEIRRFGRLIIELVLNSLEPALREDMPHDLMWQGGGYRVLTAKTPNRFVATLFGTICVWRRGYRYWHKGMREASVFPLEIGLGLVESVTPALGEQIGQQMAAAGSTQSYVIDWLRNQHGVSLGVKRLRAFTDRLSQSMEQYQFQSQLKAIVEALQVAHESKGNRKPVLSVGRDGITLCDYKHRFYEVATVATIAIFDRSGKRLTTVYMAHTPEAQQLTMSAMLKMLLIKVLSAWQGPLPKLAYVADSGGNESSFYKETLKQMLHPVTGKPLHWQRVVDYYHVAERIWTIAAVLFGQGTQEGVAWAKRILKALKKPSGASRVLHSAAALRHKRDLSATALKEYEKACAYIRKRTKFMRYDLYKAAHIPLGSGITEAACKTVFTQRLKLSGMRWTQEGAKRILILRTTLLSKHWDDTYKKYLEGLNSNQPTAYQSPNDIPAKMAA